MGGLIKNLLAKVVNSKVSKPKPGGAPTTLIYGGLLALVFGVFMLRLVLAGRKIAKLTHESNVLKEDALKAIAEKKKQKLVEVRRVLSESIAFTKVRIAEVERVRAEKAKEQKQLLAELSEVTQWSDLIIKKK